jgi:hypothetical protein
VLWRSLIVRWPTLVAALVLIVLGTWLADESDRAEFTAAMLLATGFVLLGVHLGAALAAHHERLDDKGDEHRPR